MQVNGLCPSWQILLVPKMFISSWLEKPVQEKIDILRYSKTLLQFLDPSMRIVKFCQ